VAFVVHDDVQPLVEERDEAADLRGVVQRLLVRRRFYSLGDVEEFHFPPDVDTDLLHPCLVHTLGRIQPVRGDSVRAGDWQ
jgi:hypothetical protein